MNWISFVLILACITDCHAGPADERASATTAVLESPSYTGLGVAQASKKLVLAEVLDRYHSNQELVSQLKQIEDRCSNVAHVKDIGTSVNGFPLSVIVLRNDIANAAFHPLPAFRYIGNLHGDEPTGRQLLLALALWLCERNGADPKATSLLNRVELQLLPAANPDGFTQRVRENQNQRDLNRDFPEVINTTTSTRLLSPLLRKGSEQPETVAIMDWAASRSFVASAALHEGALVANYPWDANETGEDGYAKCPDDTTFRFLASTYARKHRKMTEDVEFGAKGGITNGAEWYQISGSMQDWSYVDQQCMEITLELSSNKYPNQSSLPTLFEDNLQAMLELPLAAAWAGASGFVKDIKGAPLVANISVVDISTHVTSSAAFGDFYRPLAPGQYMLVAEAYGYITGRHAVDVPEDGSGIHHNFTLSESSTSEKEKDNAAKSHRKVLRHNFLGKISTSSRSQSVLWVSICGMVLLVCGCVRRTKRRRRRPPTLNI